MTAPGLFCCCKWHYFTFSGWVIFHCVYVPCLLHSSMYQWTFRLLPCLGYWKQFWSGHWGACILLDHVLLQICAQEWDCGSYGSSIFSFHCSERWIKKRYCCNLCTYVFYILPMFSSKSILVFIITFTSVIHFEFTFVYGVSVLIHFFLTCSSPVFSTLFIEETIFSSLYSLASFLVD